jgi:glycosyltransferase involved in cell wall biosynthesis
VRLALIVEQCLAPIPGGTGRYTRELAAALAATAPPGSTVTGWTAWHRDSSAARVDGVGGPRRLPLPRRALAAGWQHGLGPAPRAADVVHATTLLAPPRRGTPLVVTVHDAVPWTHPQTLTRHGAAWHRRMGEHVARSADRVVVPTRTVGDELRAALPGLTGDRVVVVGEGVSPALAVPPDADARAARLRLPGSGYLLSLATLEPRKGLDVLLRALADPALAEPAAGPAGGPAVPLLVVGQPGWGGVNPAAVASRLGLPADRVRVLGRLPDADLAVVLHRATALVAPSRAEGFGLPVLEAMAAGVPAVTSDAPALVEVGGGATLVVPRDDPAALAAAVRSVLADGAVRARLAAAGTARAARFGWSDAARALWTVYAEVARRPA